MTSIINSQTQIFEDDEALDREVSECIEAEYGRSKDKDCFKSYITPIKTCHEGYGHAAECVKKIKTAMKMIDGDLKQFLEALTIRGDAAVIGCGSDIFGHAAQLAIDAIKTAAAAKRLIYDMAGESDDVPIEALIADNDEDNEEADNIEYTETNNN